MEASIMKDLKELWKLYWENPILFATTLIATAVGAAFGVLAYYGGWLG